MFTRRQALTLAVIAAAVGWTGASVMLRGAEGACAAAGQRMLRLELVFGMGRKGGTEIDEAEWRAFLDAEVTPRFPDGLTVLSGYGQWRNSEGRIAKETARVLLVWLKDDAGTGPRIEAIREAWKQRHRQESVLRALDTSCVSF